MRDHEDPMAVAQAQAFSAAVDKRQKVVRSKQELRMLRTNVARFEGQTKQAIQRRYWLFGFGGCVGGIVLTIGGLSLLGWLTLPKVTLQREPVASPQIPASAPGIAAVSPIVIVPIAPPSKPAAQPTKAVPPAKSAPIKAISPTVKPPAPTPIPITPIKPENLSHAKDAGLAQDELGFKSSAGYSIVGVPADGVVMIRKNGDNTQQMIKAGGKLPDGEELRSANATTKQIETNARKFIFQPK